MTVSYSYDDTPTLNSVDFARVKNVNDSSANTIRKIADSFTGTTARTDVASYYQCVSLGPSKEIAANISFNVTLSVIIGNGLTVGIDFFDVLLIR